MRILHTADWHIGKKLHKHDLSEDFKLFIQWLVDTVKSEKVDAMLVSGDIFDLANPSNDARRAYYKALLEFSQLNCTLIITGGNHDSPSVLNAPKEILEAMDIHVIGSLPANMEDCIIPLRNSDGKIEAVVAALPYLRDPDLRQATEEISYDSRVEALRAGIARIFESAAESCRNSYPDIPAIAMGHLYAKGATTTDSEREIQIGNEASFDAGNFGDYFSYIALGHIHKPQSVSAPVPAFYSGSPIPLSFSEREDKKRLLVFDTSDFKSKSIDIPVFRQLKRLSGSLQELQTKLDALHPKGSLDTLLELELVEENYNPSSIIGLDQLVQNFDGQGAEIVKHRANFKYKLHGTNDLYDESQHLEDLKPREVFEKRLELEEFDEETNKLIKSAFVEILEEIQNSGKL